MCSVEAESSSNLCLIVPVVIYEADTQEDLTSCHITLRDVLLSKQDRTKEFKNSRNSKNKCLTSALWQTQGASEGLGVNLSNICLGFFL